MDTSVQQKKRGRKKRGQTIIEGKSVVEEQSIADLIPNPLLKYTESPPIDREKLVSKLEGISKTINSIVDSTEFTKKVYQRLNATRYTKRIQQSNQPKPREDLQWHAIVSPQIIKKICNITSFLLKNGPMTKVEDDIFNDCVHTLQTYYSERMRLVKSKDRMKELYLRTTYYPKKDSSIYKFMIEVLKIPKLR
ncbi:hypothetical protein GINT2_001659 [Glugoides intestinalis]